MVIWSPESLAIRLMKLGAPKAGLCEIVSEWISLLPVSWKVFVLCILLLVWNADINFGKDPAR